MKNKTKLVLGLAALTAVTAGVATTSTLAWFTTTRTASVSFQNIGIYGATGDLGITMKKPTNGFKGEVPTKSGNSYTIAAQTNSITDISGNGALFYKPNWDPTTTSSLTTSIKTVANDGTNYYYVQFTLELTNNSTANAMNVYLTNGTSITSTAGEVTGTQAAHAARVAIFNFGATATTAIATTATPSRVLTDGTDTAFGYISSSTGGSLYSTSTNGFVNSELLSGISGNKMVTVTDVSKITSTEPTGTAADNASFVTTIAASGTSYVGVSIWLEGESVNAVNDAAKETLSVNLHLTGF